VGRRAKNGGILTRCTQWPEVPAGQWKAGTEYSMGAMPVPIPPEMRPGAYEVATGLYNPEKKENPPMPGGPRVPIGTLRIAKGKDGKIAVTFEPIN
jgi:hypothetical protein